MTQVHNHNEIGGFFQLEMNFRGEYHAEAIKLNSGRNCLRYIIRSNKPSKVFVPFYCRNSIIEPLEAENIVI